MPAGHERAVEQFPRWSNKRPACSVFGVAWLFTHQDDVRARRSFAEDRLRAHLVQMAPAAALGCGPKLR